MAKLPGPESAGRVPPLLMLTPDCLWTIKCITEQRGNNPSKVKMKLKHSQIKFSISKPVLQEIINRVLEATIKEQ